MGLGPMGNGMTDVFALEKFKELFLPANWTVKETAVHRQCGLERDCHCEPVCTLAWQSVFRSTRDTDSHGSDKCWLN